MLIRDDVVFFCQDGMYVGVFVYVISVCEHLSLSVGMCMCMCLCLPVYMQFSVGICNMCVSVQQRSLCLLILAVCNEDQGRLTSESTQLGCVFFLSL